MSCCLQPCWSMEHNKQAGLQILCNDISAANCFSNFSAAIALSTWDDKFVGGSPALITFNDKT